MDSEKVIVGRHRKKFKIKAREIPCP